MQASRDEIRIALAAEAYRTGTVRLVGPDLAGCAHLVATRRGLFAIDRQSARLVAHGLFYGLTVLGTAIFAFEACDRPHHPTARGRIVRFDRSGDRIVSAGVVARGLDNGCHQIDIVGDRLCVADTYNQRVLRYPLGCDPAKLDQGGAASAIVDQTLGGGSPEMLRPVPGATASDWAAGYAHINSLITAGDDILLLLHNGADRTGRPSEIARLDRDWRLVDRRPVDGLGCHGLAVLEDGAVLTCGSFAGELISTDGLKAPVGDMMTRGLSVDDDLVVVGGSAFADRHVRDAANGAVFFLDRRYRPLGRITVPAPVMEIRRIDGRDRSLSAHLSRIGAAVRLGA